MKITENPGDNKSDNTSDDTSDDTNDNTSASSQLDEILMDENQRAGEFSAPIVDINPTGFQLTQSRFYSAAFNSAVFDGPLRLYFAQFQEEQALRLYFRIRKALEAQGLVLGVGIKGKEKTIFILMYPSHDAFAMCFEEAEDQKQLFVVEALADSFIVGIPGPPSTEVDELRLVEATLSLMKSLPSFHLSLNSPENRA